MSQHGPDHRVFNKQKKIFSGHYHKRQANDNVVYIGNAFPMDFGDAGDNERGYAIYDCEKDNISFVNWTGGPRYEKCKLSDVVDGKFMPGANSYTKCFVDVQISYSDAQYIKQLMAENTNIREFILEEISAEKQDVLEGDSNFDIDELKSIDEVIIDELGSLKDVKNIKAKTLVEIYKNIKIEI